MCDVTYLYVSNERDMTYHGPTISRLLKIIGLFCVAALLQCVKYHVRESLVYSLSHMQIFVLQRVAVCCSVLQRCCSVGSIM